MYPGKGIKILYARKEENSLEPQTELGLRVRRLYYSHVYPRQVGPSAPRSGQPLFSDSSLTFSENSLNFFKIFGRISGFFYSKFCLNKKG